MFGLNLNLDINVKFVNDSGNESEGFIIRLTAAAVTWLNLFQLRCKSKVL